MEIGSLHQWMRLDKSFSDDQSSCTCDGMNVGKCFARISGFAHG